MFLGGALVSGAALAQGDQATAAPGAAGAPSGEEAVPPVYSPVTWEKLAIASSAQQLLGAYVKLSDTFYAEVTAFPPAALNATPPITPDKYYAFRTRPDGSNLLCFIPLDSPDVAALKAAGPPRGTEIFIMGRVGPRMFIGDGGATSFAADRVLLGPEEPKASPAAEKKPVILTIERFGPNGNILKQEFTIQKSGQRYLIHDPANPQNAAKDIYITVQF
jgi:hypothetical protein